MSSLRNLYFRACQYIIPKDGSLFFLSKNKAFLERCFCCCFVEYTIQWGKLKIWKGNQLRLSNMLKLLVLWKSYIFRFGSKLRSVVTTGAAKCIFITFIREQPAFAPPREQCLCFLIIVHSNLHVLASQECLCVDLGSLHIMTSSCSVLFWFPLMTGDISWFVTNTFFLGTPCPSLNNWPIQNAGVI